MQFFLVSGKGTALLGLLDKVFLDLLSMICSTIDALQRSKQINVQHREAGCNTNNNSKNNLPTKTDYTVDYFLLVMYRKAYKDVSANVTGGLCYQFEHIFRGIGCLKGTFTFAALGREQAISSHTKTSCVCTQATIKR